MEESSGTMSMEEICRKISCWLPDAKRLHEYILKGIYEIVPLQECAHAGNNLLDLVWVDTDKSVDPTQTKIRSILCAREYMTKRQGTSQRRLLGSQLSSAMQLLEAVVLVSIMMSVGWSSKGEPLVSRHCDINRAHFQGTVQRLLYVRLQAEGRQTYGFRRGQAQCSIVPHLKPRCEDGSARLRFCVRETKTD